MSLNAATWSHGLLKLEAMFWLLLGRREQALGTFSKMIRRWPKDPYARQPCACAGAVGPA